jgi:hypothetical protein
VDGWTPLAGTEPPVGYIDPNSPQQYPPYPIDDDLLILPRNIQGSWEDWADSFEVFIYPDYFASFTNYHSLLGPLRRQYINDQIQAIP